MVNECFSVLPYWFFNNKHTYFRIIEDEKVNVNQKHPMGWTALQVAVINSKVSNVKVLLSCGADPNLADDFSNVNKVASAKHLYPIDGNLSILLSSDSAI